MFVCDVGQGYDVLRRKKSLDNLTARDCTEFSGERWPMVGKTAHENAAIAYTFCTTSNSSRIP